MLPPTERNEVIEGVRSSRNDARGYVAAARGPSNRVPTSTEEPHPHNSVAPLATILNNVVIFGVGGAFLNLHRLFANDAAQETDQGLLSPFNVTSPAPTGSFPLRLPCGQSLVQSDLEIRTPLFRRAIEEIVCHIQRACLVRLQVIDIEVFETQTMNAGRSVE